MHFTVQLAQAEEEFQKLSETMENQEKKLSDTKEILGLLSTESDVDIKYRLDVIATLRMLNKSISKCEENIRKLKENSTLIQKQLQLEELDKNAVRLGLFHQFRHGKNRWNACENPGTDCQKTVTSGKTGDRKE